MGLCQNGDATNWSPTILTGPQIIMDLMQDIFIVQTINETSMSNIVNHMITYVKIAIRANVDNYSFYKQILGSWCKIIPKKD